MLRRVLFDELPDDSNEYLKIKTFRLLSWFKQKQPNPNHNMTLVLNSFVQVQKLDVEIAFEPMALDVIKQIKPHEQVYETVQEQAELIERLKIAQPEYDGLLRLPSRQRTVAFSYKLVVLIARGEIKVARIRSIQPDKTHARPSQCQPPSLQQGYRLPARDANRHTDIILI